MTHGEGELTSVRSPSIQVRIGARIATVQSLGSYAMKVSLAQILARIPGAPSKIWPEGDRYATALAHGSMSVGLYAPVGRDPQTPHGQDEIYIVRSGSAEFSVAGERQSCTLGDILFVAAGIEHRFEKLSADFSAWVVFWGETGGEPASE